MKKRTVVIHGQDGVRRTYVGGRLVDARNKQGKKVIDVYIKQKQKYDVATNTQHGVGGRSVKSYNQLSNTNDRRKAGYAVADRGILDRYRSTPTSTKTASTTNAPPFDPVVLAHIPSHNIDVMQRQALINYEKSIKYSPYNEKYRQQLREEINSLNRRRIPRAKEVNVYGEYFPVKYSNERQKKFYEALSKTLQLNAAFSSRMAARAEKLGANVRPGDSTVTRAWKGVKMAAVGAANLQDFATVAVSKAYITSRGLLTPEAQRETLQMMEQAARGVPKQVWSEYDPRKPENWVNIVLLALDVKVAAASLSAGARARGVRVVNSKLRLVNKFSRSARTKVARSNLRLTKSALKNLKSVLVRKATPRALKVAVARVNALRARIGARFAGKRFVRPRVRVSGGRVLRAKGAVLRGRLQKTTKVLLTKSGVNRILREIRAIKNRQARAVKAKAYQKKLLVDKKLLGRSKAAAVKHARINRLIRKLDKYVMPVRKARLGAIKRVKTTKAYRSYGDVVRRFRQVRDARTARLQLRQARNYLMRMRRNEAVRIRNRNRWSKIDKTLARTINKINKLLTRKRIHHSVAAKVLQEPVTKKVINVFERRNLDAMRMTKAHMRMSRGLMSKAGRSGYVIKNGRKVWPFTDSRTGVIRYFTKRKQWLRAIKELAKNTPKTRYRSLRLKRPDAIKRMMLDQQMRLARSRGTPKAVRAGYVIKNGRKVWPFTDSRTGVIRYFTKRKQWLRAIKFQRSRGTPSMRGFRVMFRPGVNNRAGAARAIKAAVVNNRGAKQLVVTHGNQVLFTVQKSPGVVRVQKAFNKPSPVAGGGVEVKTASGQVLILKPQTTLRSRSVIRSMTAGRTFVKVKPALIRQVKQYYTFLSAFARRGASTSALLSNNRFASLHRKLNKIFTGNVSRLSLGGLQSGSLSQARSSRSRSRSLSRSKSALRSRSVSKVDVRSLVGVKGAVRAKVLARQRRLLRTRSVNKLAISSRLYEDYLLRLRRLKARRGMSAATRRRIVKYIMRVKKSYRPSLAAVLYNITGYKIPRRITGFEIRPVIIRRR